MVIIINVNLFCEYLLHIRLQKKKRSRGAAPKAIALQIAILLSF
jgi:hypothetical protein